MLDYSTDIHTQIESTLRNCDEFNSDNELRVTMGDSRICQWKGSMPTANTPQNRVRGTIEFLRHKYNSSGENALVLLLLVLSDHYHVDDAIHRELRDLASGLKMVLEMSAMTSRPTYMYPLSSMENLALAAPDT